MPLFRYLWKLPAVVLWCAGWYFRWCFERWRIGNDERALRAQRRRMFKKWARGIAWLIGMQIEVHGRPPATPFLIASNHFSYIDVFAYGSVLGPVFIARGDVEHWPVIGYLMKQIQMHFIDRERTRDTTRVNALLAHIFAMDDCALIFAESRATCGIDVEPFKSALMAPAVAAGIPIYPATITYRRRGKAAPPSETVAWWRPVPFGEHARRILFANGFIAELHFAGAPAQGADRKEIAEDAWRTCRAAFRPVE